MHTLFTIFFTSEKKKLLLSFFFQITNVHFSEIDIILILFDKEEKSELSKYNKYNIIISAWGGFVN